MNVFILDYDLEWNVSYYVDKHVVKMILETTQILSTVNRLKGLEEGYKPTHIHHPCVKWACESSMNYLYLKQLVYHIINEWRYRFNHSKYESHKCEYVLMTLSMPEFDSDYMTEPPQCMPSYCKVPNNVVAGYRNYYINEKQKIAKWTGREVPSWYVMKK